MTPSRLPRPAERRAQPRPCTEVGCPRQAENHSGLCSRCRRRVMAAAFLDEELVARLVGAAS